MTIEGLCLASIGISTLVTALSEKAAKDTISRNGKEVDFYGTSFPEKINYFLTDYAFIIIPFYNLYKSIYLNKIKKTPSEYVSEREAVYNTRGLLKDIKKVERKETPKSENKRPFYNPQPVQQVPQRNVAPRQTFQPVHQVQPVPERSVAQRQVNNLTEAEIKNLEAINDIFDIDTLEEPLNFSSYTEEYVYYLNKTAQLVKRYKVLYPKKDFPYEEKVLLYNTIKEYREILAELKPKYEQEKQLKEANELNLRRQQTLSQSRR